MNPSIPIPFGRYFLLEKIASGGMAEIFRAVLTGVEGFEKVVVIKRIHPVWSERREFITMLVDEAKLLVHLNHPNIVQVFELGREGETYYIAMEYVEGLDLRQCVQRLKALDRRLPPELALRIVIESLRGLHYAHERTLKNRGRLGIVHRDVSPQNILLSFEGEVKVTDFGIAKAMTQTHETQTGVLKGKYAYMSPEQAVGASLDARTDVFAAGIVLYELLFARRLFAAASEVETLDKVRKAEIPWPAESADLFPGLQAALEKALQKDPQRRFSDAESFAEALSACLPADRKGERRSLAAFLSEIFSEEIVQRRQAQEQSRGTASFRRQTRLRLPEEDPTVSLAEEPPTELEAPPVSLERAREENLQALMAISQRRRNSLKLFAALVLAAVIFTPLWFWLAGRKRAPRTLEGPVAVVRQHSESSPHASVPPAVSPTPVPTLGSLHFKALPAEAQIRARFAGGERREIGEIRLAGLPVGSEVQAEASLAGHESAQKSFTVGPEPSPAPYVFQLTKKAPGFGSLRVSAVPWGRVTMAGYFAGQETPATRGKIPEGRYAVTVKNPALGKTLSGSAVIKSGKTSQCSADFEGGKMRCW
ncbi:MAG TPA: serine/threonine-protein kinase [bacterium]|nr:serine/threonine-protein kinase [bacterium]